MAAEACEKNVLGNKLNTKKRKKIQNSRNHQKATKHIGSDTTTKNPDEKQVKVLNCKLAKRKARLNYRNREKNSLLSNSTPENNESTNDEKEEKTKPKRMKIKLPSKPDEISSNWMKLSQTLEKPKPFKHTKRKTSQTNEIWFDGVDKVFLESEEPAPNTDPNVSLVKDNAFKGLTRAVALDCEMVGVGDKGRESHLARVSIVNHFGHCILDKYVKPQEPVTDYRTQYSGIRPKILREKGEEFNEVIKEVSDILKGRILIGHAIRNDLRVLFLSHPRRRIRDTSRFKFFRSLFKGQIPSLKKLTEKLLGVQIQSGEHDSVQDAQAAMRLYTMHRKEWEKEIKSKRGPKKQNVSSID